MMSVTGVRLIATAEAADMISPDPIAKSPRALTFQGLTGFLVSSSVVMITPEFFRELHRTGRE